MLLDLDGTLVDTMGAFADVAADVMARHFGLLPRNARKLYLTTSGIPFHQQLEVIFGEHEANPAAALEFETRNCAAAGAAAMDAGTHQALLALRRRGLGLVVSSNGMQEHVDRFAARTPGLFDLALGYGGGLAKGEPHVAKVCRTLRVHRRMLAFVGDSLRDGEVAAQTGVRFVGRAGTFAREELSAKFPQAPVIDSVADLPAVV